jgi:hypothetical protein
VNTDVAHTALAALGVSFLVGPLLGLAVGRFRGFQAGVATGCLIIGLTGLAGAVATGFDMAGQVRGTPPEVLAGLDPAKVWGPTWALAVFGTLPTLFGLYFVMEVRKQAAEATRPMPRRKSTRASRGPATADGWRQTTPTILMQVAKLMMLGAMVLILLVTFDLPWGFGAGFLTISAACLLILLALFIDPDGDALARMIVFIVAIGFLLFGVGLLHFVE